jgi:hypothetical protein
MNEPKWKLIPLAPSQEIQAVWRKWEDEKQESCLVTAPEYLEWLAKGNSPEPADE